MQILVTGGAGYVGSHVVYQLIEKGHQVVVLDDLSTGYAKWVNPRATFYQVSLLDQKKLAEIFQTHKIELVVHLAAKLLVSESTRQPLAYYQTNVGGLINLLAAMEKAGVDKMIFSSTAAVYGEPPQEGQIITEQDFKNPINPYGQSKLIGEKILGDLTKTGRIKTVIFRYFNVAGVSQALMKLPLPAKPHLSHLIPIVNSYALGKLPSLTVYGDDYPTPDGTCVRDYIHVEDLAWAHLLAIDYLKSGHSGDFNLGSGQGYSVKQVVETAQKVSQVWLKYQVSARRPGDPAWLVTSYAKAQRALGFKPRASLADMIKSDYQWRAGATKGN